MKHFLKKISLLMIFILVILYGSAFIQRNSIWVLTNSLSADAKLCYARKMKAEELDVIAIGSSMTLNNLNSAVLRKELPDKTRYFNYSAWGLTMEDSKILLDNLLQTSKPSSVIMFSNIVDFFDGNESRYKGKDLRNYMDGLAWNDVFLALKYGFPHNLESIKNYAGCQEAWDGYTSLCFDPYGGVPLEIYGENINKVRWDTVLSENNVKEKQYEELKNLCKLAKEEGIRFYFVQTPFRLHYLGENGAEYMENHQRRCRQIVEESGQYYYNAAQSGKYDDSYFSDYIHLNKEGSELLTEEFAKYYMNYELRETVQVRP